MSNCWSYNELVKIIKLPNKKIRGGTNIFCVRLNIMYIFSS